MKNRVIRTAEDEKLGESNYVERFGNRVITKED